jgi:hypothetical protein
LLIALQAKAALVVTGSCSRADEFARHVVNNARPLLIALPSCGNMPANENAAPLNRGTDRENEGAETQN